MSTAAPPPLEQHISAKTASPSYAQAPGRRHFWLRRIHSLMGLLFGAYITIHLLTNATAVSPRTFQQNVDKIHSLEPMLPLIEIVAIFIPLLVHTLYGIYISKAGVKFNTTKYNYGGNLRYTLQRWTAWILLLFIAYHIATLHRWGLAMFGLQGYPKFIPRNEAYQSTVSAIQSPYGNPVLNYAVIAFYLLGTLSAVFHWANGLWTSAIAWGLTVTANAQKKWGHVCLGFGIILAIIGTTAWAAFAFGNPLLNVSQTQTLPTEKSEGSHDIEFRGGQTNPTWAQSSENPANQIKTHLNR